MRGGQGLALLVVLVAIAAEGGACHNEIPVAAPAISPPPTAPPTELVFAPAFPLLPESTAGTITHATFADVCAGASSLLVTVIAVDDTSYRKVLLYGTDGATMYGCASGGVTTSAPCAAGTSIAGLPSQGLAVVEGIDRTPVKYMADDGAGADVVCRGETPIAFPAGVTVVTMLRVGDFNGLMTGVGPTGSDLAGAALGSAGRIVVAGGRAPGPNPDASVAGSTTIWRFDPATLTMPTDGALSAGRYGLAAAPTTYQGRPAMLFAGGIIAAVPVSFADLWQDGEKLVPFTMTKARAYDVAAAMPGRTGGPAVAVIGGCDYDPADSSHLEDSYELFFPDGVDPNFGDKCSGSGPGFCLADSGGQPKGLNHQGCRSGFAAVSPDLVWVGGGIKPAPAGGAPFMSNDGQVISVATVSAKTVSNEMGPSGHTYGFADVLRDDGSLLIFGGATDPSPTSPPATDVATTILQPSSTATGVAAVSIPTMISSGVDFPRAFHRAVTLRDGSVLLAAGFDGNAAAPGFKDTILRYVPTGATTGTYSFVAPPGLASCTPGSTGTCVRLFRRRDPVAARIDGSGSWLDGAVLFAGGHVPINLARAPNLPELFVPAYACDAANRPLMVPTSASIAIAGAGLRCDRHRAAEAIPDPRTP